MKLAKYFLILCAGLVAGEILSAAPFYLSGTVCDSLTSKGIPDVNITLKGTDFGTVTSKDGSFIFLIPNANMDGELVISHIAYHKKLISVEELSKHKDVILSLKNIELREVQVEANRKYFQYDQPMNNSVTQISADEFEAKGFVDAADILASDQSTTIDEDISGRKSISIRGSNNYEVMILYDGVRINNNFDNLFDLSLINPASIQQIDVIKGSNSASFGAFGSSAVINFIPRLEQDYLLRFSQRVGTYDSGDWGVNFYKNIHGLKLFSSVQRAGSTLQYMESSEFDTQMLHKSENNTVNLAYEFGKQMEGRKRHQLRANYITTERSYDNLHYANTIDLAQGVKSINYSVKLFEAGDTKLAISNQNFEDSHFWNYGTYNLTREILDNTFQYSFIQTLHLNQYDLFLNYIHDSADLSYTDIRKLNDVDVLRALDQDYTRDKNGFAATIHFERETNVKALELNAITFNFSHEWVDDILPNFASGADTAASIANYWNETSYTINTAYIGYFNGMKLNGHFSYGVNYTIPTLYQQLLAKLYWYPGYIRDKLLPEYKKNLEVGVVLSNASMGTFPQFEFTSVVFHNTYSNKFRTIHMTGSPISLFDNHTSAEITGLETSFQVLLFKRDLSLNSSMSKYFIDDKVAFPFKPDLKFTAGFTLDIKNFNLDFVWFYETEREGKILASYGQLQDLSLPPFSNIDIHIKKSFNLWRVHTFVSLSGRNIFSKERALEGITLRDRRIYFTLGFDFK